jgi:hypothetical protein
MLAVALDWSAELLRLSLFSNGALSVSDGDWLKLTGNPTSELRQVHASGSVYGGAIDNTCRLQVSSAHSRIDVIMSAPAGDVADVSTIRTMGPLGESTKKFSAAIEPWLKESKFLFNRVAVGASFLFATQSSGQSLAELEKLLSSVNGSTDGMEELFLRVNWPQSSKVIEDLKINRITSWSALQLRVQLFQVAPIAFGSGSPITHNDIHAVRLEIDHSTDEKRAEVFNSHQLIPIYEELLALAFENAEKGERP